MLKNKSKRTVWIQKKLTEEEDRVEVTRLLLRQKQRKLAKEKEKLQLLHLESSHCKSLQVTKVSLNLTKSRRL
jgi:hypothetical protein